jgi:hypothetical protein
VTEHGDPAGVDVDAFRHVDIDVAECRDNGHRCLPVVDRDLAQIEVEIGETADGEGPPAQP